MNNSFDNECEVKETRLSSHYLLIVRETLQFFLYANVTINSPLTLCFQSEEVKQVLDFLHIEKKREWKQNGKS